MWHRLTTNWTFIRGIYVLMGVFIVIQSAQEHFWAGIVFGGYFFVMGLFGLGCASSNCTIPKQGTKPENFKGADFKKIK